MLPIYALLNHSNTTFFGSGERRSTRVYASCNSGGRRESLQRSSALDECYVGSLRNPEKDGWVAGRWVLDIPLVFFAMHITRSIFIGLRRSSSYLHAEKLLCDHTAVRLLETRHSSVFCSDMPQLSTPSRIGNFALSFERGNTSWVTICFDPVTYQGPQASELSELPSWRCDRSV